MPLSSAERAVDGSALRAKKNIAAIPKYSAAERRPSNASDGVNATPQSDNITLGANKDAPIVGLVILSGLKKDGDAYAGGQILDPDNGKLYSSKVQLSDGGKKLNVRGYIGVPMLGRSQTWVRQE